MLGIFKKMARRRGPSRPFCTAVLAAGGSSVRMEGENKLLLPIDGIPVIVRALQALCAAERVDEVVIAARESDMLPIADLCHTYGLTQRVRIVQGGTTRAQSVLRGALEASPKAALLAVHDGARPLVTPELIDRVIECAERCGAAAPAIPVKDTVKVAKEHIVVQTPERSTLFAVQTPQVFDASLLKGALQAAQDADAIVTDDCAAVERIGKEIYLTDGDEENIKITTPLDVLLAEAILRRREESV